MTTKAYAPGSTVPQKLSRRRHSKVEIGRLALIENLLAGDDSDSIEEND